MSYQDFVKLEFFHNTIQDYLVAIALFIFLLVLGRVFRGLILGKLKILANKTATHVDDGVVRLIHAIPQYIYDLLALYCALQALEFPIKFYTIIHNIFLTFFIIQALILAEKIIEYVLHFLLKDNKHDSTDQMMFSGVNFFVRIGVWTTGILLLISNMGLNVNSLITSLGIGGVAVALAAQNIFSDLFSSFSIYFDKPFVVGDNIEIGNDSGTVIKIGLKTTRIKSSQGEEIVISNRELTSARIHNFHRMEKRTTVFTLTLDYSNDTKKIIEEVPRLLEKVFIDLKDQELDRANLKEFGDFGIVFEIVYFYPGNDYKKYMQGRHEVNCKIKEEFDKAGIKFATRISSAV